MANQCASYARGRAMRLTRLDSCGIPVEGADSTIVTSGFVQVVTTPVYQDAEEIQVPNANGDLCIDDQADPALRWLTTAITLCNINPVAINILTGDPIVLNDATPTADSVGFRIDAAVTGTAAFALEIWTGVPGQACGAGGSEQFGYWLYPFVVQAQFGEWTVGNAGLTLDITARTSPGSGWGVGPYADVRRDATTDALEALLTPITETQHMHFELTSAPVPAAGCEPTALPVPDPEALMARTASTTSKSSKTLQDA
jgi:hypothetical protein